MEIQLPRSTTLAEGIDASAIDRFIQLAEREKFTTHSLMIARNGKVVFETWWEPYRKEEFHLLYSLTKSFASTAVGFAISEGAFGLDDRVIDLFPEQAPAHPSENLRELKVRHLLSMSVGHEMEPTLGVSENDWETCARLFLAHPLPYPPGVHFLYNTAASNMLSILVQKTTGEQLDGFLNRRLFQPLGIETLRWTRGKNFVWGGSGLHATTETIAKLGLLYLNRGGWNGIQVLPEEWAETATAFQVPNGPDPLNDWNQGYGFQFWRCRHDAIRGDGAFGQFCIMLPEQKAVIAITSGESDMQKVLNAVWDLLLPAFDHFEPIRALPPANLSLGPKNRKPAPTRFAAKGESLTLSLEDGRGSLTYMEEVPLNVDEWVEFSYGFGRGPKIPARAKAGWTEPGRLEVEIWNPHSPQQQQMVIETEGWFTFKERGVFDPLPSERFRVKTEF